MYKRVAPRDLFNEANYMKCIGQIALNLHDYPNDNISLDLDIWEKQGFRLNQTDDGELYDTYIGLVIKGNFHFIYRPLNSREKFPIFIINDANHEIYEVLNAKGKFTKELIKYSKGLLRYSNEQ